MVDALRAYRRWMVRRLAVLLPAFFAALGVNVWLAMAEALERWLRVIGLVLSGLGLSVLGWLLFETITCARLHARGERRAARALRGQLALSGNIAGACLLVFAVLLLSPFLTRMPGVPTPQTLGRRPAPLRPAPPEPDFTQIVPEPDPPPALAAPAGPPTPAPAPEIRPIIADVPSRLEVEEKELEAPVALAPFLQPPQDPPRPAEPEPLSPETLAFRPELEPPPAPTPDAVDRPGLWPEDVDEPPAPTVRLEVLLLSMEEFGRGGGVNLEGDYALGRNSSLHASFLGVAFGSGEIDELESDWTWQRMTLGYLHRLLGYTRHASFDLAVTVGASLDRFRGEDVDGSLRVSPYAAVDVGIWQGGPFGFLLHAGHGLPFNAGGAASRTTDVSVTLRLDLSERVSLFAGYRMLWVELKEYPGGLSPRHGEIEFDSSLAGPLLGVELRF